jgi:hypothetical protein
MKSVVINGLNAEDKELCFRKMEKQVNDFLSDDFLKIICNMLDKIDLSSTEVIIDNI